MWLGEAARERNGGVLKHKLCRTVYPDAHLQVGQPRLPGGTEKDGLNSDGRVRRSHPASGYRCFHHPMKLARTRRPLLGRSSAEMVLAW